MPNNRGEYLVRAISGRLPEDHDRIHGYTTVQADAHIAAPGTTVRMEAASTGFRTPGSFGLH
ncbi:MAG: hypothetical protein WC911_09985 [Thermoleophilia bacterium]